MIEKSKWIWHKGKFAVNEYVDFVTDISINNVDENAAFYISVDTEYTLWINGEFVNCGQYHDYPQKKVYDILPVGKYLKKGENRIAIKAYYQGEYSFQYRIGERGVCFSLVNSGEIYKSSKNTRCRISKAYTNGEIHKTTRQLAYGWIYDAEKEDNWKDISYDVSAWEESIEKEIKTDFVPRPIKKLDILPPVKSAIIAQGYFLRENEQGTVAQKLSKDYLSHCDFNELFDGEKTFPVTVKSKNGTGIYIIVDIGKEECGFINLSLCTNAGTVVDVGYGEHLEDMRVRTLIKNSNGAHRHFANRYICKDGEQSFTHHFKRIAGRYLQIHISGFENLKINYCGLLPVCYPFEKETRLNLSDKLHSRIFDVCVDTLKLCMHEHYEDCPWREQALYGLDSRNQMLYSYYAFGDYEFTRASLDLLGQGIREDGFLQITSPTDETLTIPSFTFFWLIALKEYVDFSGDTDFARYYWAQIEDMVGKYTSVTSDGLIVPPVGKDYWQFYEWSDGMNGNFKKENEISDNEDFKDGAYNLIFYMTLKELLSLAVQIGEESFVSKYTPILDTIKSVYNEKFWNEKEGVFNTYLINGKREHLSEFVQAIALYCGICDSEKQNLLCDVLLNRNDLAPISLGVMVYKYDALVRYDKKNLRFVFDDIAEKWGHMLYKGATSFWETLDGEADFNNAGSLCHGWTASPLYFYCKYAEAIKE